MLSKEGNLLSTKKSVLFLFISVSIILFAIFIPFYLNGYAFNIGQDFRDQFALFYYDFVQTITNSIKTRTLPFYSFDIFLGNSYWSSRLFYYNNIYDFITYPISVLFDNIRYEEISIIQLSLKAYVSALSMFSYVKYRKFNNEAAILASLAFTFSSFYFGFISFHFFLSFYSFVPLYFLLVEVYLKNEKYKFLYILMVSFLLITNYYQFYTLSIITVFYYLWRYFEIHNGFKNIVKNTYLIIIFYLIGVLITAPITIPNFIQLLGNNRLNEVSNSFYYPSYKTYLQIFTGFFLPSSAINQTLHTIFTNEWTAKFSFAWAGSITALVIPQVFYLKNKKASKIALLVLFGFMLFPFGSSILLGFTDANFRWTQFIPLFTIIMSLDFLEKPEQINKKVLMTTSTVFSLILLFVPTFILVAENLELESNLRQIIILVVYSIFIITTTYLVMTQKLNLLKYVLVFELIFIGNASLFYNQTHKILDNKTINGATSTLANRNQLNAFLNEQSRNEFYRVYVDYGSIYWGYSYNMNLKYDFKGLMSYDSLMTTSSHDIDKIINQNLFVGWGKSITNNNLIDFFNTKYAIVTDQSQLPHQNFTYFGDYNYGLQVYENNNYYNLIRTYNTVETYTTYSKTNDAKDINEYIICDDKDYESIKKHIGKEVTLGADVVGTKENYLYAEFTSNEDGFASISIPFDIGWTININGSNTKYFKVNAGVIGIPVYKGINIIEMTYRPPYFSISLIISSIGIALFACVLWIQYHFNK